MEKQKNNEKIYKEEHGYAKLLLEELRREDELFTSRFNLFLIAESLLFLSYATLLNKSEIDKIIVGIMGLLGILITIIYSVTLRRTHKRIGEIREKLREENKYYRDFEDMRECKGHVHVWLCRITILFLLAWIGLLIFSF